MPLTASGKKNTYFFSPSNHHSDLQSRYAFAAVAVLALLAPTASAYKAVRLTVCNDIPYDKFGEVTMVVSHYTKGDISTGDIDNRVKITNRPDGQECYQKSESNLDFGTYDIAVKVSLQKGMPFLGLISENPASPFDGPYFMYALCGNPNKPGWSNFKTQVAEDEGWDWSQSYNTPSGDTWMTLSLSRGSDDDDNKNMIARINVNPKLAKSLSMSNFQYCAQNGPKL